MFPSEINNVHTSCVLCVYTYTMYMYNIHISMCMMLELLVFAARAYTAFMLYWFQPLSAADYLELCRNFSILFVQDIPQLTLNTRTETRRFITLIDNLYDNKVSLSDVTRMYMYMYMYVLYILHGYTTKKQPYQWKFSVCVCGVYMHVCVYNVCVCVCTCTCKCTTHLCQLFDM